LAFEGVSFAYQADSSGDVRELGPPVLSEVSFELPPGGRVALLGASGGGKSTTGKLVARLFDPVEGQITYADKPLTQFDAEEWRAKIGYVGQEVFLFHGTIAENIRFGALGEVSDEEVRRVARIARVDEIAAGKADGLQTQVGEKGVKLSGGQKKRIGLARALIRRPRILVVDQLAADLEADLCRAIFEDLRREFPRTAILHVGHRVPAGFAPDRVFWMERGELAPYRSNERDVEVERGPVSSISG
jgi:ATP-binding cassette subfamily B protein AbcA/BmrA